MTKTTELAPYQEIVYSVRSRTSQQTQPTEPFAACISKTYNGDVLEYPLSWRNFCIFGQHQLADSLDA